MSENNSRLDESIEQKSNFNNIRDERRFLHEEIAKQNAGSDKDSVSKIIKEYKDLPVEKVLSRQARMSKSAANRLAEKLAPDEHDDVITDLISIIEENGIYNTLNVVARMNNPHIEDDLHRFLVQYLISGHTIPGLVKKDKLDKALDMKLYSITFPENIALDFRGLAGYMEQFLAGMQNVSVGENNIEKIYFSLELALSEDADSPTFYISVPNSSVELFEEQIHGLYDGIVIEEVSDDYNIFAFSGAESGSCATPYVNEIFPIKTHDMLGNDTMPTILDVFRRMKRIGEGAAIQIICAPVGDKYIKKYWKILEGLKKGEKMKDLVRPEKNLIGVLANELKGFFVRKADEDMESRVIDDTAIRNVTRKLDYTIFQTNIRIIASAENQLRADTILRELESSFRQFDDVRGNSFQFERPSGSDLKQLFRDFSFRTMNEKQNFPLNLREIASIYHFIR